MPAPEIPQGDPESVFCRWCNTGRVRVRGASLCVRCDVPKVAGVAITATWQRRAA